MVSKDSQETLADYHVDLICGGFPCQSFSQAGKQLGQDDHRWLWPEFYRVLCLLRPRYVLIENVPPLRYLGLSTILRDLATLGYDAEWYTLSARAFGARHLRRRIWIVAYPCGQSIQKNPNRWEINFGERGILGDKSLSISEWPSLPEFCRMSNGIPFGVDRLRGLGNAVVPQVVEWIGRQILKANE